MKILLISLIACVMSLTGLSQSYEPVPYQVIVHDSKGQIVANKPVSLRFSLYMGNPFDTVIYSETQQIKTSDLGLVSALLGKGTRNTGDFASIDWNQDKYFMKVEIDAAGGSNFSDIGTIQILIIPYTTSSKPSKKTKEAVSEDKLIVSRRYMGKFIEYRQTGPDELNGPNIIWIKTTMDKTVGKISAYGKKCDFAPGDNLYLKRMYYSPGGVSGRWEYRVENDSSVYYRLTEYQYDHKMPAENWFK